MDCRIDNGKVLGSDCGWMGCNYTCNSGYRKVRPEITLVYCDTTSGRWLLPGIESPPCQKYFRSHETKGSYSKSSPTIGSIAGSVGGIILLIALYRIIVGIAHYNARRRPSVVPQDESTGRLNKDEYCDNSEINVNEDNNSRGFFIFRIRRLFTSILNSVNALRNPPEPPPYDAENAAPSAHEESENARLDTSETISDKCQLEREAKADRRQESPPAFV